MQSVSLRRRAILVIALGVSALIALPKPLPAGIWWSSGCTWCADECSDITDCENVSGSCGNPPTCNDMHVCIDYEEHVHPVTIKCGKVE